MKILQIGKFYPIRGGVEKVMYDLMLGISERGVSCDMLCAATEDQQAGSFQLNPYARLIVVPTTIKLSATMMAPGMVDALRKMQHEYDIIHIHHPDPMACLALYLSGYKGKVVLYWHSDILKQKMLLKLYAPLQKWLIKRAQLIVGTSPVYVQASPFLRGVQSKVDFIPIGVEPMVADRVRVNKIRHRYEGRQLVFSLGRLVAYKGYEHLIRAAKYLPKRMQILIGGTGPLRGQLEKLIHDEGVGDRVELLGFIADEDVPTYFEAARIFVLSSVMKTEAFGIVQIEAMSCGKPVISTRIPGSGVGWVNKDRYSGLVVPIADENSLAAAIMKVMDDPILYDQLANGAKQRYHTGFTRQIMVDKCLQLYKVLYTTRENLAYEE